MNLRKIIFFVIRIFLQSFFAAVSFIVLFFLAGIFFAALGAGAGAAGSSMGIAVSGTGQNHYTHVSGNRNSQNYLLQIDVEGLILGSPSGGLNLLMKRVSAVYGYEVKKLLKKAASDSRIKGVLLRCQTPGGTIFGSMAIYEGISEFRQKSSKPVLAYVEGISASGGMMAMVGADVIYADYGSMVGSIGVMGPDLIYYDRPVAMDNGLFSGGIVTQGGIEATLIHAGKGKDLGFPFRRPDPEEVALLQKSIENEYQAFVAHVAKCRSIPEETVKEKCGAHIFDNLTAKELGLIDGTLNYDGCVEKLAEMANTGGEYQVVVPQEEINFLEKVLASARFNHKEPRAFMSSADWAFLNAPLAYYGNPAEIRKIFMEAGN